MCPTGSFVEKNGEKYYKISDSRSMPAFLINVVSPADVWLFMSSKGGVTAGRVNAQGSVFPYETDDKLNQQSQTGSKTLIRVGDKCWEPFERTTLPKWDVAQNIYKSARGTSVIFEEINRELELAFSYRYTTSGKFGVVKTAELKNIGSKPVVTEILDGLENLLPYHVNDTLQATSSTLVDAYKANELAPDGVLAVYSMTTQINDTPTPVEAMKANVAWTDLKDAKIALSSSVVEPFARGEDADGFGCDSYGCKGAYFVCYEKTLGAGESARHSIVADAGYDHCALTRLQELLEGDIGALLDEDVSRGGEKLYRMVADADGVQQTGDQAAASHHYLNTLYNIMRGGSFLDGYGLDAADFMLFAAAKNRELSRDPELRRKVESCATVQELKRCFAGDDEKLRLALEYLPLSFSRRHGDPSRPWNKFNIILSDERGNPIKQYEGNWRDIFQNWEALGTSFPEYYENMLTRFVDASTVDGFNPYRILRDGVDWERPEPGNPFSGLGYWGDHQIIYMLRLLKGLNDYYPDRLLGMLARPLFTYANVPYRIAPFDDIVRDSKHTVEFDEKLDAAITELVLRVGTDGQLLQKDGRTYQVCLMEKLIVPMLCKMANLLPGGGVWMNTQRPEWNDANNAIVGIGLSMVTVYHMRSYLVFLRELIKSAPESYEISAEVAEWLGKSLELLRGAPKTVGAEGWKFLEAMGRAFESYRSKVYESGFGGKTSVGRETLAEWVDSCLDAVDFTISAQADGIFASYNLLGEQGKVEPMRPMLEGQSAAVGASLVAPDALPALLDKMDETLRSEKLGAHCLYPVRLTAPFLGKNTIRCGVKPDGRIVLADERGELHFAPGLTTDKSIEAALAESDYSPEQRAALRAEYERLFRHGKFTGRSEVMYKFEGIGCVYWHQNAKLALALMETALDNVDDESACATALDCFRRVTDRFLYRKTPAECGALPLEPYSHSSFDGNARQPGMTGQVKESLLMRRGELGVIVKEGRIRFVPRVVRSEEFGADGELCFTLCGVPVRYVSGERDCIKLETCDGKKLATDGLVLSAEQSAAVFGRSGIRRITVTIK